MEIFKVRIYNAYTGVDTDDTFWVKRENAENRVKELNDEANENSRKELVFYVDELETSDEL